MLAVDGTLGAPGLELSHWPGNRTPRALEHELSTGCVLRWARLGEVEREALAVGCTAIVNTHYDTDGVCAMFAARHPELALEHAGALLEAAAAGDFFRIPSDRALALDALVSGLNDLERSPLRAGLEGLDDSTRHERLCRHLVDALGGWLASADLPHREVWEPVVEDAHDDVEDLRACHIETDEDLDLCVFTAAEGALSTRTHARPSGFDPGRHALFEGADTDRVLVVAPRTDGTTYRFLISTLSWFELPGVHPRPRPDLRAVAAGLNSREGILPEAELGWRAQARTNASPELWFGREQQPSFSEHSAALRPSRLSPEEVTQALLEGIGRAEES